MNVPLSPRGAGYGWADAARVLAAAVALVVLAWLVRTHYPLIEHWLLGLGPWAPVTFVAVHLLVVPLGFPVSVLGVLAGATFGWLMGTALMLGAGLVSASVMYGLARHVLSGRVRRWVAGRASLRRMADLIEQDAVRLMVLLRLSPLHYALVSYLLGAWRVPFPLYLATSLLVLPSAAFQAYVGHAARVVGQEVAAPGDLATGRLVFLGLGLLATAALALLLGRAARRALAADTDDTGSEAP